MKLDLSEQRKLYADHIRKEIEKSGILVEKCGTNHPTENQLIENFEPVDYSFHSIAIFLRKKDHVPFDRNLNEIARLFNVIPNSIHQFFNKSSIPKMIEADTTDGLYGDYYSNFLNQIQSKIDIVREDYDRNIYSQKEALRKIHNETAQLLTELFLKDVISDKEKYLQNVFERTVTSKKLYPDTRIQIEQCLGDSGRRNGFKWQDRSLVASALTVSNMRHFDDVKADLLLDLILENEEEMNSDVLSKAILGYVLSLYGIRNNHERFRVCINKFKTVIQNKNISNILSYILIKLWTRNFTELKEYGGLLFRVFSHNFKLFLPFSIDKTIVENYYIPHNIKLNAAYFLKLLENNISLPKNKKFKVAIDYFLYDEASVNEITKVLEHEQQSSFPKSEDAQKLIAQRVIVEFLVLTNHFPEFKDVVPELLRKGDISVHRLIKSITEVFSLESEIYQFGHKVFGNL